MRFREPNHANLATIFTEADLPAFCEALNDADRPFTDKDRALELIACLAITNRDAAVDHLVDFMRRSVEWDKQTANTKWAVENVLVKDRAVMAICKVGGILETAHHAGGSAGCGQGLHLRPHFSDGADRHDQGGWNAGR